jgi:hypothetical protein
MSSELAEWLMDQIAVDERVARAATPGPWRALDSGVVSYDDPDDESGQGVWPVDVTQSPRDRQDRKHIAAWDPQRVLADCEAKRRIVEGWRSAHEGFSDDASGWGAAMRVIARPYAGRPGWRREWAL